MTTAVNGSKESKLEQWDLEPFDDVDWVDLNDFVSGGHCDAFDVGDDERCRSSYHKKRKGGDGPPSRRMGRKKPKGMPKRRLTAYNLFFKQERWRMYEESADRVGFQELGRIIGARWRNLTDEERKQFERETAKDAMRYRKEMEAFDEARRKRFRGKTSDQTNKAGSTDTRAVSDSSTPVVGEDRAGTVVPIELTPTSRQVEIAPCLSRNREISSGSATVAETTTSQAPGRVLNLFPAPVSRKRVVLPNSVAIRPGMEVILPDKFGHERRYCVQYTCYRMTRAEADAYIRRVFRPPS